MLRPHVYTYLYLLAQVVNIIIMNQVHRSNHFMKKIVKIG